MMVQKPLVLGIRTGMLLLMNRIKESTKSLKLLNTKSIGNFAGYSETNLRQPLFDTIRMTVVALIIYIVMEDDYFEG